MSEQQEVARLKPDSKTMRSVDVWLWRIYSVAFVLFLIGSVRAALAGRLSPAYWLILVVGAIPFVFLVRSLAAFPGRFSLGGDQSRDAGRRGAVLLESQGGSGSIGGLPFDRVDWRLYQYGLDVRVPGAGWGFVPAVSMRSVTRAKGRLVLEHWASEVRSPVELESSPDLMRMLELWIDNREPANSS